jgi:hypothetical protein
MKYEEVVKAAQLKHLLEMRVDVSEMVHVKAEVKADITLTGAGGLTVGDWVEVEHDFTPGNNSGGGVGAITDIVDSFSFVRYILDGHTEKFIPFKRLTTIPMPFRREKAELRTRSSAKEQEEDPSLGSKWRKMNCIESLQYGLANGLHKKEGWLWNCLVRDGVVADTQAAKREKCFNTFQAQKVFVMAQQQLMPEGWDPRSPSNSVKVHSKTGQFVSLQKVKNPVPANIVTNAYLRYAYGVPKETFRRWIGEGATFEKRVPHNKGKNVIDDKDMAKK